MGYHIFVFRRKRATTEYTRWRANLEPTEEFIVKIFDDEISTTRTKHIEPVTKGNVKIIVEGVSVPPHTAITVKNTNNDYTRFISFTKSNLAISDIVVPPLSSNKISSKIIKGKMDTKYHKVKYMSVQNSERDDSPPASPQFVTRTDSPFIQQFAPITPVAFARKPTLTPRKGSHRKFVTRRLKEKPTRTSPNGETSVFHMPTFIIDNVNPFELKIKPQRTTLIENFSSESQNNINVKSNGIQTIVEKETEAYINMFYTDEDNQSLTTKKIESNNNIETTEINENTEKNDGFKELNVIEYQDYQDGNNKTDSADSAESTNSIIPVERDIESYKELVTRTTLNTIIAPVSKSSTGVNARRRQLICSTLHKRALDLNSQDTTLYEIVAQLKKWAENSPVAKWVDITNGNYTNMDNPIYMMIVDDPSKGQIVSAKETVLIVSGIQGKDHHAVAASMYLLHQLIERSESHSELLTKYRFWIIPVLNPDGYDYSMTFPRRREWAKNLRQTWNTCEDRDCVACHEYGISCTIQPCYGVNLDRNFEYQWIPTEELRSEYPCGPLYAGPRQLSEVETQALTHYLHEQKTVLYTFIAYKEGEVLGVMYPYSHTKKKRTIDYMFRQRASRAANAAYSLSGRPYAAGQTSEFLPLYAGGIEDWVDGHLGIDNTFTIMMFRPTDDKKSNQLMERVVREAYAATHTLLLYNVEPSAEPIVHDTRRSRATTVMPARDVIFTAFIILLGYG